MTSLLLSLSLLSRDEAPGVVTGALSCVRDGQEGPDVRHRGGRDRGHAQHQPDGARALLSLLYALAILKINVYDSGFK